jgi:hypothetical protein
MADLEERKRNTVVELKEMEVVNYRLSKFKFTIRIFQESFATPLLEKSYMLARIQNYSAT